MPFLSRRRPVGRAPRCFAITYSLPSSVESSLAAKRWSLAAGGVRAPAARPRCERLCVLERNVVVGVARAGARGLEVTGVGRDVALRGEAVAAAAVAVAGVVTTTEELNGVGDDLHGVAVRAGLLVLPLAVLETTVDRDRTTLGAVLGDVLALGAPDRDVEEVGLVLPLTGGAVLATRVDREAQAAHGRARRQVAQLWVAGEVAGQDDPVDVASCHSALLTCYRRLKLGMPGESTERIGRFDPFRPGFTRTMQTLCRAVTFVTVLSR